jgi:hypothetical protein
MFAAPNVEVTILSLATWIHVNFTVARNGAMHVSALSLGND